MLKTLIRLFQSKQVLSTLTVRGKTFPYLEVHTSDATSPVLLIGLHGFGSDETQIETLVNLALDTSLIYLAPRVWYTLAVTPSFLSPERATRSRWIKRSTGRV